MTARRGEVYAYGVAGRARHLLVVSVDALTTAGSAIVIDVDDRPATVGPQALLAVALAAPFDGWLAKTWRLNYMSAERLVGAGERVGAIDEETMERITAAIKAAIEP